MIKLFEQFNDYNQVDTWLYKMGITNYTINDDLTVDVDGNVRLQRKFITEIPIQFGNVNGDFYCNDNQLTSLMGSPNKVGGDFYCSHNQLTSLMGCPKEVSGNFYCSNNQLTSLMGYPKGVGGNFYYSYNELPDVITDLNSDTLKILIKYQEEYGIWNSDESFNKERFDIFQQDLKNNIIDI